MVQTSTNPAAITINDAANATPYPSTINVSGVTANVVTKVQVRLNGFGHTFPADVDVLLVEIGLVTPPVGLVLFVLKGMSPNVELQIGRAHV